MNLILLMLLLISVRVVDDKLFPPGDDKWDTCVYIVTFPKGLCLISFYLNFLFGVLFFFILKFYFSIEYNHRMQQQQK